MNTVYSKYLIGPSESSIWGMETVMVLVDGLELTCCKAVCESNDGARIEHNIYYNIPYMQEITIKP